jgi:hypothetical protein
MSGSGGRRLILSINPKTRAPVQTVEEVSSLPAVYDPSCRTDKIRRGYYNDGIELGQGIELDFNNLTHLVITVLDYDFHWDLAANNDLQPERDLKKTVITFYQTHHDDIVWEDYDAHGILSDFEMGREEQGLKRIALVHANLR